MTQTPSKSRVDAQAIQVHLGIVQSVIARMAANSASSKTWCITLVAAILAVVADKNKVNYAWIAAIPTILFWALDTYYLALEKSFRASYETFVEKFRDDRLDNADLYAVLPDGAFSRHLLKASKSFSVWPLYVTIIGIIYLATRYVL